MPMTMLNFLGMLVLPPILSFSTTSMEETLTGPEISLGRGCYVIDNLVDIVASDEAFSSKLIFKNTEKTANEQLYEDTKIQPRQ